MNSKKLVSRSRGLRVRHTALAMAVAMSMGLSGQVSAQATTGSVFGSAPVSSGETVRIANNQTGLTREVSVGSDGRYGANQLPVGDYTVSLMQGGNVVATRDHVQVSVSGGTAVPFAADEASKNAQNLSGLTVTANELPAIDVSSTRQSSVITAQQLKVLPLARSAEAIALLAPGANYGSGALGVGPTGTPLLSLNGNSAVENAYYLNGFNTTDPIGGAGGVALPYFAIAEQQTITSGYGPEYGRSTGGVVSQIGQRGSNEFHAGVYASWQPSWAEGNYTNIHYNNPLTPVGSVDNTGKTYLGTQGSTAYPAGYKQIEQGRKQNSDWETVYDAYVSGPLIKDKLFFYITAEWQHDSTRDGTANDGISEPTGYFQSKAVKAPKIYGKLDWNINDSNVLEATFVQSQQNEVSNNYYNYDYSDQKVDDLYAPGITHKNTFRVGVLKYTSYITDDLTLEAQYGVMTGQYYTAYSGDPDTAQILTGQGVTLPPGTNIPNVYSATFQNADHKTKAANLRVDLDWKITADHDLKFGIDNEQYRDDHDGFEYLGGTQYTYINGLPQYAGTSKSPYVTQPGPGNYVEQKYYGSNVNLAVRQKAQYVEDRWQVTPNLLLDLGVRNDQFTNLDGAGQPYVKETSPQWAPRLGASWDVFGDSTFKVFANAGRYYLALPAGLAVRNSAFGTVNGQVFSTYTSIDANGIPHGLTPIAVKNPIAGQPAGFYSADGENGIRGNTHDYASTNLKPEYQDEYALGFQKTVGDTGLVWGEQATYQKTKNFIDDTDIFDGAVGALVNPGKTNYIPQPTGLYTWNPNTGEGVTAGFLPTYPVKPERKYYALDNYLEHTWDGKWFAKLDYVFSKSYGNDEGPTNSYNGQITNQQGNHNSGSASAAWDFTDVQAYTNGDLANDHRHTIKAFGAYAITPEWTVSGTIIVQSGSPKICVSGYGDTIDGDVYGGAYQHFCGGVPSAISTHTVTTTDPDTGLPVVSSVGYGGLPSPPNATGRTPWTHQLDLSLTYTPDWANKHLTLQAQINNLLNEQKATLYTSSYVNDATGGVSLYDPTYLTPISTEMPRYVTFNAKYDF